MRVSRPKHVVLPKPPRRRLPGCAFGSVVADHLRSGNAMTHTFKAEAVEASETMDGDILQIVFDGASEESRPADSKAPYVSIGVNYEFGDKPLLPVLDAGLGATHREMARGQRGERPGR